MMPQIASEVTRIKVGLRKFNFRQYPAIEIQTDIKTIDFSVSLLSHTVVERINEGQAKHCAES